jgi:hypothetical protein
MKSLILILVLIAVIALIAVIIWFLIPKQAIAKTFGGTTEIQLQENHKLINVTWKDSNIWVLTRPMKNNEESETYTFKESSTFGLLEGTVNIIEKKK